MTYQQLIKYFEDKNPEYDISKQIPAPEDCFRSCCIRRKACRIENNERAHFLNYINRKIKEYFIKEYKIEIKEEDIRKFVNEYTNDRYCKKRCRGERICYICKLRIEDERFKEFMEAERTVKEINGLFHHSFNGKLKAWICEALNLDETLDFKKDTKDEYFNSDFWELKLCRY